MKAYFTRLAERIDARSLRERLLIFAMAALIVSTLVTTLALDPAQARRKVLQQQIVEQQARISASQAQIQTLAASMSVDPDAANRARLEQIKARAAEIDAKMASFQKGLIGPDRMAEVLRDLLSHNRKLKLVSLRTLPATSLMADSNTAAAERKSPDARGAVYRHGVEITVEGSYADLLAYTSELESLSWHVNWGSTTLSAQAYPVSRLTLTLYTMSLEKAWLSV